MYVCLNIPATSALQVPHSLGARLSPTFSVYEEKGALN